MAWPFRTTRCSRSGLSTTIERKVQGLVGNDYLAQGKRGTEGTGATTCMPGIIV